VRSGGRSTGAVLEGEKTEAGGRSTPGERRGLGTLAGGGSRRRWVTLAMCARCRPYSGAPWSLVLMPSCLLPLLGRTTARETCRPGVKKNSPNLRVGHSPPGPPCSSATVYTCPTERRSTVKFDDRCETLILDAAKRIIHILVPKLKQHIGT
jgi:hypothetical protein